jgi:hypothetical protein
MTTVLPVREFEELLTCSLCTGYYRDAHTILECMHTFCKSCILVHFHNHNQRGSIQCPQCNVSLGLYGHLASKMIYDRDLQNIVDKIFPQFLENEKVAEEKFYAELNIPLKAGAKKHSRDHDNKPETSGGKRVKAAARTENQKLLEAEAEAANAANEEFIVKMVPAKDAADDCKLPALTKRLCKATKSVRVIKLKNFVHKRLPEEDQQGLEPADIKLIYNGTDLGAEMKLGALGEVVESTLGTKASLEFEYCLYKARGGEATKIDVKDEEEEDEGAPVPTEPNAETKEPSNTSEMVVE